MVALALVPTVALAAVAGLWATREAVAADRAVEVRDQVDDLDDLVDIRTGLLLARAPVEIEVRATALGLDRGEAVDLLGISLGGDGDLASVRDALGRIPEPLQPFDVAELDQLAAAVAEGASVEVLGAFGRIESEVDAAWDARTATLERSVVDLGDVDLARELDDLEAASSAGLAGASMVTGLADYWFSSFEGSAGTEEARLRLVLEADALRQSVDSLVASEDPVVAAVGADLDEAWQRGPFSAAIDDAVAGRPPAPFRDGIDAELVAATFADSFELFGPLLDVIDARATVLSSLADRRAEEASRAALVAAGLTVATVASVVAVSVVTAAGFERPLGRLIDGIRRVGDGDLAVEPLDATGPAEVVAATTAFNDLTANLRLLEAQVRALAASDLDDPSLAEPLPGGIGAEMAASVEVLARSVAARTELEERLAHQATHDPLTGVANRAGALAELERALARARRHGHQLALAFLDLDDFKAVNDDHGHGAGDVVLQTVAERLAATARTGDLCARFGGDEFLVVAEEVDGAMGARSLALRLAAVVGQPIEVDGATVGVGASIGMAMAEPDDTPLTLIARADVAAYEAKRSEVDVVLGDEPVGDEAPPVA